MRLLTFATKPITTVMKKFYHQLTQSLVLLAATAVAFPSFSLPLAPAGLKAGVKGTRVDLSWTNGDAGEVLLDAGFEDETFPPQGWSQKVTNNYEYLCSWFHYPSDDFKKQNNWEDYIHSGDKSAMLYFDIFSMKGDHATAQDEWLMTPSVENAAYLDLYYFIDPMILDYGADESFPDHYYIKVSYDNGATWQVLWDARNDALSTLGWHNLVLPLKGGNAPMVAFQGVSDTGDIIHLLWAVDDVKMLASKSGSGIVDGYTIMCDGVKIAEHVRSLSYADLSPKEAGEHLYEVFAESGQELSPAASTSVTIEQIELLPPANVRINAEKDEQDGTYLINIDWDAPQGGVIEPIYYNVYCDGMELGTMLEDLSIQYYGYTKGIYDFAVTAVYENPDGESLPVGQRLAIDTRFNVRNLRHSVTGGTVKLEWDAPEKEDCEVSHYEIWRGDKRVTDHLTDLVFTDSEAAPGKYRYYVETFYTDGVATLPAYTDAETGDCVARSLPFAETFDSGHLPADWHIDNLWDATPENLLWQFGDPNGLEVKGEGFDGGFASIDCINSGFYALSSALTTPVIDITGCDLSTLAVTFSYDYASDGFDSTAALEIETDGSGDWTPVLDLVAYDPSEADGFSPSVETIGLTDEAWNASTIRLRWNYNGMFDYHLALDNVKVFDGKSGVGSIVFPTAVETARYDITGRRLSEPAPGINIIRYSDGTSRKVVVK